MKFKAKKAKADMEETSRREYKENWVGGEGDCKSDKMERERAIAEGMRSIRLPSVTRKNPD